MPAHPERVRRNYDGVSMRAVYNAASEGTGLPEFMMASCEHCGGLVTFHRESDTTTTVECDGCDTPLVTLTSHNPRRLGVITGITE